MPSITSWNRLERRPNPGDLTTSTAARIFDPLWMLTRQWQLGEFQAEDRGTPSSARIQASITMLTRIHLGELAPNTQTQARAYDPGAIPLEVMVERRSARAKAPGDLQALKLAVEAGQHFLRMIAAQPLSKNYRPALLSRFALQPPTADIALSLDGDTTRFLALMAGRAVDARDLQVAARASTPLEADPALGVSDADRAEVHNVVVAWLTWYDSVFSEPATSQDDAWVPDRLEYQVSVAARLSPDPFDERTLTAVEFPGGRLDWNSFDINAEVRTGTDGDAAVTAVTRTLVPAPVRVPGGPAVRFWQFEDARLDYGRLATVPTDLAHTLLTEYATSYGNDWFSLPLKLPIGSLTRIDSLVVTDSFGVRMLLSPIGDRSKPAPYWSMWQLAYTHRANETVPGSEPNLFFLPPSLGDALAGPILEDVLFLRDEAANLAWGIERILESPVESPAALDRNDVAAGAATTGADPGTGLDLGDDAPSRYLLSTAVPTNWIPLLPVELVQPDGKVSDRLQVGAVLQPDGSQLVRSARTRLLNIPALTLFNQEVPREGVGVTRNRRLARWIDGSTWLWAAQSSRVGRREGSSSLRFDGLEPGASDA